MTPPVTLIAFVVGPIEPATNRGFFAVVNSVRRAPRKLRRRAIQFVRASFQSVFGQHNGRAAKRVRLDDVRAGFEVRAMNSAHHVGPARHQILVAAFQLRPAEILGRQLRALQHRPHRAVNNEHALREQLADFASGLG